MDRLWLIGLNLGQIFSCRSGWLCSLGKLDNLELKAQFKQLLGSLSCKLSRSQGHIHNTFLSKLQMVPIHQCVTLHQTAKACQDKKIQLIGPCRRLQRKCSVVNTAPWLLPVTTVHPQGPCHRDFVYHIIKGCFCKTLSNLTVVSPPIVRPHLFQMRIHPKSGLLVCPENVRLAWKRPTVTNTKAYDSTELNTAVKRFILQAPTWSQCYKNFHVCNF